jgi:hypothetical protein
VKNILGIACRHFLYLNLNKGTALSSNQKKVNPQTKIKLLCDDGIVSK